MENDPSAGYGGPRLLDLGRAAVSNSSLASVRQTEAAAIVGYSMPITVHHLENSRSQRVLWLLEELGLPYEVRRYERNRKTMLAPLELRQVHPLGKSPVIEDSDSGGRARVIAETGATVEYLVEKAGGGWCTAAAGGGRCATATSCTMPRVRSCRCCSRSWCSAVCHCWVASRRGSFSGSIPSAWRRSGPFEVTICDLKSSASLQLASRTPGREAMGSLRPRSRAAGADSFWRGGEGSHLPRARWHLR